MASTYTAWLIRLCMLGNLTYRSEKTSPSRLLLVRRGARSQEAIAVRFTFGISIEERGHIFLATEKVGSKVIEADGSQASYGFDLDVMAVQAVSVRINQLSTWSHDVDSTDFSITHRATVGIILRGPLQTSKTKNPPSTSGQTQKR